jgi:hypothetical protein
MFCYGIEAKRLQIPQYIKDKKNNYNTKHLLKSAFMMQLHGVGSTPLPNPLQAAALTASVFVLSSMA